MLLRSNANRKLIVILMGLSNEGVRRRTHSASRRSWVKKRKGSNRAFVVRLQPDSDQTADAVYVGSAPRTGLCIAAISDKVEEKGA